MVKGVVDQRVTIGIARTAVLAAHTVRGYAFTWPVPPGSVEADVTVNSATYKTPFEEKIPEGTRLFKATYDEQTLEEEIAVDEDLTVLFLFDPLETLSNVIVLPTAMLPPISPIPA